MAWCYTLLVATIFLCVGCKKPTPAPSPRAATSAAPENTTLHMDHAQPKLPTLKVWLGPQELVTEIARTPVQVATGMMFRKEMAENEAMLFVFNFPEQRSFWMKNVNLPLSCAYIDPQGMIIEIHDMQPHNEAPIPSSSDKIQYVLETRQGWFARHNIGTNTIVRTELGSLGDTFFRRSTR